jgi:TPR repeat protein
MQALCLADANNPKKNERKAFKMLKEAASGSAAAQYQLAKCYEEGIGTEKNTDTARDLILQAAEKGDGNALSTAGDLYFEGKGVAQDYVKAVQYYLQAEALSKLTASSAQNLIKCYNMSISNLPDLNKKEERIKTLNKISSADNVLAMLKKL